MRSRVVVTPRARLDLVECFAFIAADSVAAADRFLQASNEVFDTISRLPHLGRAYEFLNPQLTGLRWLQVPGFDNYLVFYRPADGEVKIVRVLHGSRDIKHVLDTES